MLGFTFLPVFGMFHGETDFEGVGSRETLLVVEVAAMSSHQLVDDGYFGGKLLFVHVEGLVRRGHCRIVRIGVIADGHAPSLSAELAVDAYLPSGLCVADEVGQQV